MIMQNPADTNLRSLMDMLASKDGMIRQKARKSLVALGKPAVSSLVQALDDSEADQLRWEAAKALGAIGDAGAAQSLVHALEDPDTDVTWLAAEGLKKLKKTAWPPLLRALIKSREDSVLLRQGALHVLRNQKEDGFDDLLATLTNDLESNTIRESTPLAARGLLEKMKKSRKRHSFAGSIRKPIR
jgi:HEAT repeat protein